MLTRLANLGIRRPKRVLAFAGLLIALAAIYGAQAASHLASGGFYDTGASSWQARNLLATKFNSGDPNLVLEVSTAAGVDSAAARTTGLHIVDDLTNQQYVTNVTSYWTASATAGTRAAQQGRARRHWWWREWSATTTPHPSVRRRCTDRWSAPTMGSPSSRAAWWPPSAPSTTSPPATSPAPR